MNTTAFEPSLVFDTETNGLFDFSKPADDPSQPRLASVGFIEVDEGLRVTGERSHLIKPDGWVMGEEAGRVNGLTMERLHDEGIPVAEVLDYYETMIRAGRVAVAFNAQWDCKMMRAELRRAGRDDLFQITRNICVMRPMTDICQLMPAGGRAGYKFPKLSEALEHIGVKHDSPHTGRGDAYGAFEVMRWLHARDLLPAPGVHLAKKKDAGAPKMRRGKPAPVSDSDEIPA